MTTLRLKTTHRHTLTNPSLSHLFSSSSSDPNPFADLKASLRRRQQQQHPPPPPPSRPHKSVQIDEIRKNLTEYRSRSIGPIQSNPSPPGSGRLSSFSELYNKTISGSGSGTNKAMGFNSIRESLRQINPPPSVSNERNNNVGLSMQNMLRPKDGVLPKLFDRERSGGREEGRGLMTDFVRSYTEKELGEKLRILRPPENGGGFSLKELSERMIKLRKMEEEENKAKAKVHGGRLEAINVALQTLAIENKDKEMASASEC